MFFCVCVLAPSAGSLGKSLVSFNSAIDQAASPVVSVLFCCFVLFCFVFDSTGVSNEGFAFEALLFPYLFCLKNKIQK
jgi:hypothetical protein